MSLDSRYTFLRRLAPAAGALALAFWRQRATLVVELKGPQDFVSRADREVEAFIRSEIAAAFPDDGFLGEETAASFAGPTSHLWIVDPIDGTTNFLRGLAYWNVSIAYVENGVRTLGAVYDASQGELFHARRGGGAWCTDVRGEQRLAAAPTPTLRGSVFAVDHHDRYPDPRFVAIRDGLMNAGASYRSFGAAALQLAHVAAGRLDAYIQCELAAWDAMAGLLLVEEAGGYAAPFPGPKGLTEKAPVVATAPGIAAEVSAIIAVAG
ncbi:MAG: inositol monophosphatase [Betaproteobacteria bacterium]|nr:inositol monophosphatase [Betaproteobacteria bacterium]